MKKTIAVIIDAILAGVMIVWGVFLFQEFNALPKESVSFPIAIFNLKIFFFTIYLAASVAIAIYMNRVFFMKRSEERESPTLADFQAHSKPEDDLGMIASLDSIRSLLAAKLSIIDKIWDRSNRQDMDIEEGDDMIREETLLNTLSSQSEIMKIANMRDLFERLVDISAKVTGAARVSLFLFNPDSKKLSMLKGIGFDEETPVEISVDEGIAGYAFKTGKRIYVTNIETHPDFGRKNKPQYSNKSFVIFPLRLFYEDNIIGVLNLTEKETEGGIINMADLEAMNILLNNFKLRMENLILIDRFNIVDNGKKDQ